MHKAQQPVVGDDWITATAFSTLAGFQSSHDEDELRRLGLEPANVGGSQGKAWTFVRRAAALRVAMRVWRHRAVGRMKDFGQAFEEEDRLGRVPPLVDAAVMRNHPDRLRKVIEARKWLQDHGAEVPPESDLILARLTGQSTVKIEATSKVDPRIDVVGTREEIRSRELPRKNGTPYEPQPVEQPPQALVVAQLAAIQTQLSRIEGHFGNVHARLNAIERVLTAFGAELGIKVE